VGDLLMLPKSTLLLISLETPDLNNF